MKRKFFGAVALAVVALTAVLIGTASAAKPPPAPGNSACPSNTRNVQDALNVGASYDAGTYSVERFGPDAQTSLVKYCVYTDVVPSALDATAVGADGSAWTESRLAKTFSFSRPGGEPTNLALTGSEQPVGIATFPTEPTKNDIVLHISDGDQCFDIYGVVTPTCFVTPAEEPGPVCDDGDGNTDAAYNAIPTDVEHCAPPSLGFEANQVAEFGDRVTLNTAGGTNLVSMTVDFQSYGCETSGHWNTGDCVSSSPAGTFTVPGGIKARIYNAADLSLIAESNVLNPNIPFRPSAISDASCPNPPADPNALNSRFMDPVSGQCNYSLSVPLTFTFAPGTTFTNGQDVVWTVQFNTTHYGYNPIGEGEPCFGTNPGCGYDSLNVGAKSYPGAPYAGTDVDDDVAYLSTGGSLAPDTGWALHRPLGQIVTGP
jgi:hypothetical protein